MSIVRTTITIDGELHRRVKQVADRTGRTIGEVIEDASPNAVELIPGQRHWAIVEGLCRAIDGRGNDVPDAFLAALTIEAGGTWWSADRGFARFRDLRWRHPLDG